MSLQLAPMASGAVGLPPAAPQGGEPAQVHVVLADETLSSIGESCNTILTSLCLHPHAWPGAAQRNL